MRNREGEWVNTPRRRRARWLDWQKNGADFFGRESLMGMHPLDTPEVAEDVHPKTTWEHEP